LLFVCGFFCRRLLDGLCLDRIRRTQYRRQPTGVTQQQLGALINLAFLEFLQFLYSFVAFRGSDRIERGILSYVLPVPRLGWLPSGGHVQLKLSFNRLEGTGVFSAGHGIDARCRTEAKDLDDIVDRLILEPDE